MRSAPWILAVALCCLAGCGGSRLPPLATHPVRVGPASGHDAAPHGEAARVEDHGRHGSRLVIVDLTTGRRRVVARSEDWRGGDAGLSDPVFSPDGGRVAVSNTKVLSAKDYIMVTDVLVASVSGRTPARRVPGIHIPDAKDLYGYKPSWSPDGRAIVGVSDQSTFLSDIRTGRRQTLLNRPNSQLTFAPDGESYMFSEGGLWRVDATTGHRRKVVSDRLATHPLWSPDGRSVAYLTPKDGRGSISDGEDTNSTSPADEVHTTSPSGTRIHRITNSDDDESHLLWSTDTTTLLWQLDNFSIHGTCLPPGAQPDDQNSQSWSVHATTRILTRAC